MYLNTCIIDTWKQGQKKLGNLHANTNWYSPRTGGAYIIVRTYGIYFTYEDTDTRDYAQVRLTEPLKAGCTYEASCYILSRNTIGESFFSWVNHGKQCADGLGFYFSKDSVYREDAVVSYKAMTDIVPQVSNPAGRLLTDSVHYQKVSGIFTAQGGEEWLVLGNFEDNAHTQALYDNLGIAVYAVDDVSVQEWKPDLISFADTTLCADSILVVSLPEGLKKYKWSTGETTRQIQILADGIYTVEATNGCTILRDTFTRKSIVPYTDFTLGRDSFFCKIPALYELTSNQTFDQYVWSTGATTKKIRVTSPGTYWLNGKYVCGALSDTIEITEFHKPSSIIEPAKDTMLCSNQSIELTINTAIPLFNVAWNDGSTADHLTVHTAGPYSVRAYSTEGCEVLDTIDIRMVYPPVFKSIQDTVACEELPLILSVYTNAENRVRWYDGVSAFTNRVYSSGVYWYSVSNSCYTVADTVDVSFVNCQLFIPNLITVNGDYKNDVFEIQTAVERNLELSLYNSWGSLVYENVAYKNNWGADGLSEGMYYYQIHDPLLNKKYKGWVHVMK